MFRVFGTSAAPLDDKEKMRNITVTLPEGTQILNDSEIICTPAKWKDIAIFFLVNYVTHALTTVVLPGEGWESYLTNALASLMFPGFGAYRGLRAIFVGWATVRKRFRSEPWEQGDTKNVHKHKARRARDLQKARRAGALCMVVRSSDWVPGDGDEIEKNVILVQGSSRESFLNGKSKKEAVVTEQDMDDDQALLRDSHFEMRSMSGSTSALGIQLHTYSTPWTYCRKRCPDSVGSRTIRCAPAELSPGYSIIMVPACTPVRNLIDDAAVDRINSNYDIMRGLVALVQALLAIQTLYQTRGNQVERFGYAAFGLTVAPYAVMSLVNLLGSLARPDYDAVYMVGSPVMEEERRRKGLDGYYDGVVGEVFEADTDRNESFADNKVEEGSQFVKSPVKFVTVNKELYVKFANWGVIASPFYHAPDETFLKVSTSGMTPDSAAPWSLFVPNASPFSYNRAKKGDISDPLPSPLVLDTVKWPGKLLPRSTRYIKRSRYFAFILSLSPVIIIFVLSKFRSGSSTIFQQAITMLWLAWGSAIGFLVAKYEKKDTIGEKVDGVTRVRSVLVKAVFFLVLGWPAVAGWWVVAEMLLDYGKCVKLPG
ncbi:uncharacterized protein N0V89_003751 [Didymosphaeria variabile]|uniref:Uncharacterized protein n=1 Tax=Didymosphaeria variabile TaxID=1932322 RepID=A0A9W8XQJ0_9PLEO|nr:uncharacterized protein N0V89_003751 [Didymosphaeria variabile]KAJ4355731.1 hypothetical protein N0V89_003751 [Didymosphaeria variabile]